MLVGALCHCRCLHYPVSDITNSTNALVTRYTNNSNALHLRRHRHVTHHPILVKCSGHLLAAHLFTLDCVLSMQRGGGRINIVKGKERDALQPLSQRTNSLFIQMNTTRSRNTDSTYRIKGLEVWLVAHDQCQVFSIMFCHLQN
jgi:hypothetical protein